MLFFRSSRSREGIRLQNSLLAMVRHPGTTFPGYREATYQYYVPGGMKPIVLTLR